MKDVLFYSLLIFSLVSISIFIPILINFTGLINTFPLTAHKDISSHIARLYFFSQYGFDEVPYWFNGYKPFAAYPFLFYLYSYIFLIITDNLLFTIFISIIFLYIIGFLLLFFLIKRALKLTKIQSFIFSSIFFFNYIFALSVLEAGRFTKFFGWIIFIPFSYFCIKNRSKKMDLKESLIITILLTILLFAHPTIYILSMLFLSINFFANKKNIKFLLIIPISLFVTSFWWTNFLTTTTYPHVNFIQKTLQRPNLFNYVIINYLKHIFLDFSIFIFWFLFLILKEKRKELIILFIFSILYLSKILLFIPFMYNIFSDDIRQLFLFVVLYLIFDNKIFLNKRKIEKNLISLSFFISAMIFIFLIISNPPGFINYTQFDEEKIYILSYIDDKFIVIDPPTMNTRYQLVSYAPIYYNLSTPQGWVHQNEPPEITDAIIKITNAFINSNCSTIEKYSKRIKAKYIITYNDFCSRCPFNIKANTTSICLIDLR